MSQIPRGALLRGAEPSVVDQQPDLIELAKRNDRIIKEATERDFPDVKYDSDKETVGLALSGGGVRSAYVCVGVLRALDEKGLLPKVDYISAVSGGSYAMTWYMDQVVSANTEKRDVLGRVGFQKTIDTFSRLGNVSTLAQYTRNVGQHVAFRPPWFYPSKFWPRGGAAVSYRNTLDRTFLTGFRDTELTTNGAIKGASNIAQFSGVSKPLFLYNMTIENCSSRSDTDAIFEVSQRRYGNEAIGFAPLSQPPVPMCLKDLTGISGAAMGFALYENVSVPSRLNSGIVHELTLADGGHMENLGAVSLVKRGVTTLIIVDAENDHYKFGAYRQMQHLLAADMGLKFEVPSIERHLREGAGGIDQVYHYGTIRNLYRMDKNGRPFEQIIRVHYLKMTLPRERLETALGYRYGDTSLYNHLQWLFLEDDRAKKVIRLQREINSSTPHPSLKSLIYAAEAYQPGCRPIGQQMRVGGDLPRELNEAEIEEALACSRVTSYSAWLGNEFKCRWMGYQFPQTTTFDQSYYGDQSAAFISLGYLMGLDLPALKPNANASK